jgi:hypothetical protein
MSGIRHVTAKAEWDRYETARRAMSGKISSAIPPPTTTCANTSG